MKKYEVLSGPMLYTERVTDDGRGPQYDVYDICVVEAKNKAEARKKAVKFWQDRCPRPRNSWWPNPCCYPHHQRMDGLNPFAGLTIRQVDESVLKAFTP